MKFLGPLLVVNNIEKSKDFYVGIMKQEIKYNFEESKIFKSGLSLRTRNSMKKIFDLEPNTIINRSNNNILYFEMDDFASFIRLIEQASSIEYVSRLKEHEWGQRRILFYDPDFHIINVSESIESVFKRMFLSGMKFDDIAKKTEHDIAFIKEVCSSFYN